MRRPCMIVGQPAKRATARQLGRVSAAADRAERPRCPSAWLAGSRTTFRTSCGINTAGGGAASHPLVPHTVAAAPGEVANFGLTQVGQLARFGKEALFYTTVAWAVARNLRLRW